LLILAKLVGIWKVKFCQKMNNKNQILLEEAIEMFERTAESLIRLLSETFDLNLSEPHPFGVLIQRQNKLWKGYLEGDWKYHFHGDACKFENMITGQIVDVKINREGNWGTISNFYLFKFIETSNSLKHVYQMIDSEHKVIELLEKMQKEGKLVDIGRPHLRTLILNKKHLR